MGLGQSQRRVYRDKSINSWRHTFQGRILSILDLEFRKVCSFPLVQRFSENGELPRSKISDKVYTVINFYPPNKPILWHVELVVPDGRGSSDFCLNLPSKEGKRRLLTVTKYSSWLIREFGEKRFLQKGIMYLRNYGYGVGLDWQAVFQTNKKSEVEDYCRKASIEFEWKNGDC